MPVRAKQINTSELSGLGGATGPISIAAALSIDISGIAAPTPGLLGASAIGTLDHPGSTTITGQRVQFQIPDDYQSGNLTFRVVYAMSTAVASPNNNIYLTTKAEIAKLSTGLIDTTTYPETGQTLSVPETTIVTTANLLTITGGGFGIGDTIQFFVKRDPTNVNDVHTGNWQIVSYEISYTGVVASRNIVQEISLFLDTDETAPLPGTKGNFNTLDFSPTVSNEQKFQCHVPDNWDTRSDMQFRVVYAMSTSVASSAVVLQFEADIADISGGSTVSVGATTSVVLTPSDTSITRSPVVFSLPASILGKGDTAVVKVKRAGADGADTHTGNFQLISANVTTGASGLTGVSSVLVASSYLYAHDFTVQAGSPNGETESPTYSGDFESWILMTGNGASEQIDVAFQGRLSSAQATITEIKVPLKGSAGSQYKLKVYVDNTSPSTAAYDSSAPFSFVPQNAPTTRTVTTLAAVDLSKQPVFTGGFEGRFFVVVEAYLDNAETLRVGRPFVTLE